MMFEEELDVDNSWRLSFESSHESAGPRGAGGPIKGYK